MRVPVWGRGNKEIKSAVAALAANEVPDQESRLVLLLSLTDMYAFLGDKDSAAASCSEILACTSHLRIRNLANELKAQYKL